MAEYVEKQMQEMVLEIEEMERLNLLSPEEIKKLIEKRREMEYKLNNQKKEKREFINYVLYESKLIQLLHLRRKKLLMFKRHNEIERTIKFRVVNRLRLMTRLWVSHQDLWKLRISFAKAHKLFDEVSSAFVEQVRFHGNDENVWVAWAQWEMEGRSNFDKARDILLSRAPLYHPQSLNLSREYFRLELLYVEYLKKKSSASNVEGLEEIIAENREKILDCSVADLVYEDAKQRFTCADFLVQFYSVAEKFPFAHKLRDRILSDLLAEFPKDASLWTLKGKMILEGKDYSALEASKPSEQQVIPQLHTPLERLKTFVKVYKEGLKAVGSSFLEVMIRDLFKILFEVWGADEFVTFVNRAICGVFRANAQQLSPAQRLLWFKVAQLMEKPKGVLKGILRRACEAYPDCQDIKLEFYKTCFPKLLFKDKLKIIEESFGEVGAAICDEVISHSKGKLQRKLIDRTLSHHNRNLCKVFRVRRMTNLKNFSDCRAFYETYSTRPPFCADLHASILEKELKENEKAIPFIRKVFERALEQFGSSEPGLWLCFIEFERRLGEKKSCAVLQERATVTLEAEHVPRFVDLKFALKKQLDVKNKTANEVLIDHKADVNESTSIKFWLSSPLPLLFEDPVSISHSVCERRDHFFQHLNQIYYKQSQDRSLSETENHCERWERVCSLICGSNVSFTIEFVDVNRLAEEADEFCRRADDEFATSVVKRYSKLSDRLEFAIGKVKVKGENEELKSILDSSDVLKSDFERQKELQPFFRGKNAIKKDRQKTRLRTAGQGWFDMKAPERTEELARDLNVLKMRSILDPSRHYKRSDMKEAPKYFQMGKVLDSAVDFYTSRVPRKERKRNLAEEIINEEKTMQYQKRKYSEIIERKQAKRAKILKAKHSSQSKRRKSKVKTKK